MSFDKYESSRSLGMPITLYRFVSGGTVYGYTDCEVGITYNREAYLPIPIDRDAITQSGSMDNQSIEIRMPVSTDIAEIFRVTAPNDTVTLTIFAGHDDDPDGQFVTVFKGRVLSAGRLNHEMKLTCESIATSMRRVGLRRRWQLTCPHILYGAQCKADITKHTTQATVLSSDNQGVTMAAGWNGNIQRGQFENGLIWWGTQKRNILQVSGDKIVISGVQKELTAGTVVSIAPGCGHDTGTCINLFANIQNFGGQPWIPTDTPTGNTNRFY